MAEVLGPMWKEYVRVRDHMAQFAADWQRREVYPPWVTSDQEARTYDFCQEIVRFIPEQDPTNGFEREVQAARRVSLGILNGPPFDFASRDILDFGELSRPLRSGPKPGEMWNTYFRARRFQFGRAERWLWAGAAAVVVLVVVNLVVWKALGSPIGSPVLIAVTNIASLIAAVAAGVALNRWLS